MKRHGRVKNFFTDNINGILGAISLHLLVIAAFLGFRLGDSTAEQKQQVLIEFNEELLLPPETPAREDQEESGSEALPSLDGRTLHSIASNVSAKLDEEISTSRYEQQVMQELGISTLKTQGQPAEADATDDENAIGEPAEPDRSETEIEVPNVLRKDNTTVSYFLENRWHKFVYIPTYKCQGGGTVILDIVINQSGQVVAATVAESKSTKDPCLLEEAYRSASSAQFNADMKAPPKQLGTITYVFLAQ